MNLCEAYNNDQEEFNYVSELTEQLKGSTISLLDFLERVPESYIPCKNELIEAVKKDHNKLIAEAEKQQNDLLDHFCGRHTFFPYEC